MSATKAADKIGIECPSCHQRFSAAIPKGDIINSLRSSGVIAVHPKPTLCICGQPFILGVNNAVLEWGWQVCPPEVVAELEDSCIVLPGPGLKLAGN